MVCITVLASLAVLGILRSACPTKVFMPEFVDGGGAPAPESAWPSDVHNGAEWTPQAPAFFAFAAAEEAAEERWREAGGGAVGLKAALGGGLDSGSSWVGEVPPGSVAGWPVVGLVDDVLPGTEEVQAAIWRHQHPADCSQARFFVATVVQSGIGSMMHQLTGMMAEAMELDRVMVWEPGTMEHYTDVKWCASQHGDKRYGASCYFLPPTWCTFEDANNDETAVRAIMDGEYGRAVTNNVERDPILAKPIQAPTALANLARDRGWTRRLASWWRAQAAAYLFRFGSKTSSQLLVMRRILLGTSVFPRGAVSVHVRTEAAKAKEMRMASLEQHVKPVLDWFAAEENAPRVVSGCSTEFSGCRRMGRILFLSTEDPDVVEQAMTSPALTNWTIHSLDVPRVSTAEHPETPQFQVNIKTFGAAFDMLNSLFNLALSLECDAWVGQHGSNWIRLINELRGVWVGKASHRFFEAGEWTEGW